MQRAAQRIVEKLHAHGHETFFAGGWVRDFLLRRKPKDIDIATSAHPDEVIRLFPKSVSIGAKFGVIQVSMYGHSYEVATFRSDNPYIDGRHPSSVKFSGPEQDAYRRDFTVNGLFYDPLADRLIDYVHGKADIQNKLIRTIGSAKDRFDEDKLRIMRAIRLACSLNFEIVRETWEAIRLLSPEILQISWERIRDELLKILTGSSPARGLELLHDSGILFQILPEVVPGPAAESLLLKKAKSVLGALRKPSTVIALAVLLQEAGGSDELSGLGEAARPICRRLRLSNDETDRIVELIKFQGNFWHAKDLPVAELKRLLSKPHIDDHLELHRANCIASRSGFENYWFCLEKIDELSSNPFAEPLVTGEDLIEMGYTPGPIFKEILRKIEDLQLEGVLQTREEALNRVKNSFPLIDKIYH
jgi:tRNA nucleotidyltransferase/poly(A) polymerase